jgi:formamidopyrimidine-DNA glycosylase
MPELPDIVVYIEALERRILGRELTGIRVTSPAVIRTYDPPYDAPVGHEVVAIHRVGKRIALEFDNGLFLVIHLMIAGRLRWETPGKPVPRKVGLAALDFADGTVILTE